MSDTIPAPSTIRDEFEKLVLADLHGPAGGPEEEVDESSVSERYLVGMLSPRRNPVGGELLEGLEVSGRDSREDGKADVTAPQAEQVRRLTCGRGWTEGEARGRLMAQRTDEAFSAAADVTLENTGSIEDLARGARAAVAALRAVRAERG